MEIAFGDPLRAAESLNRGLACPPRRALRSAGATRHAGMIRSKRPAPPNHDPAGDFVEASSESVGSFHRGSASRSKSRTSSSPQVSSSKSVWMNR